VYFYRVVLPCPPAVGLVNLYSDYVVWIGVCVRKRRLLTHLVVNAGSWPVP